MRLYGKECKKTLTSIVFWLFVLLCVLTWYQNFYGVTGQEIRWAEGGAAPPLSFDRPLLAEPSPADESFGSKTVEDPQRLMSGATDALLMEYEENSYATYPLGYYKAVSLSEQQQARVGEILCEITGLSLAELRDLPPGYFPSGNGAIIHFDEADVGPSQNGFSITMGDGADASQSEGGFSITMDEGEPSAQGKDEAIPKVFTPQVSYERFKELMTEMEQIIGEKGSKYSMEMMISYHGLTEMTYEEAQADYRQTVDKDKITGGFARLFCDYMGQMLGLLPAFLAAAIWLKDSRANMDGLIYSRKVSSFKLVASRFAAGVSLMLVPVLLLSLESLIPLMGFAARQGLATNTFSFLGYIMWWLLPTVMLVFALSTFLTLLTDSPIAILVQFVWWMVDRGVTGLSGDTGPLTLMLRHNTLRGYEVMEQALAAIWTNRLILVRGQPGFGLAQHLGV